MEDRRKKLTTVLNHRRALQKVRRDNDDLQVVDSASRLTECELLEHPPRPNRNPLAISLVVIALILVRGHSGTEHVVVEDRSTMKVRVWPDSG